MTPTIHLHIGEPKSGTTFLQGVMRQNRVELRRRGLLVPGHREQIKAAHSTIRDKADRTRWKELAATMLAWSGTGAVISMETLCRAEPASIRATVAAFGSAHVRIVITARDLVRTLPAQWQQSTQHRKTWSWHEYYSAVVDGRTSAPASRNFWSQHDLQRMVEQWSDVVPRDRISVVTLPHRGGEPTVLWRRFATALDLEPDGIEMVSPSNESLGVPSAELLRRLNLLLEQSDLSDKEYGSLVRSLIVRTILAPRRSHETRVRLPESAAEWATGEAERIIGAVEAAGVQVIGDLADLRPQFDDLEGKHSEPVEESVTDAAVDAIRGLVELLAERRRSNPTTD